MCQATIYLDGKEIMQDVTLVEILPDGVRLKAFFDTPVVISRQPSARLTCSSTVS
jgi:predicted RNA-binding protein